MGVCDRAQPRSVFEPGFPANVLVILFSEPLVYNPPVQIESVCLTGELASSYLESVVLSLHAGQPPCLVFTLGCRHPKLPSSQAFRLYQKTLSSSQFIGFVIRSPPHVS